MAEVWCEKHVTHDGKPVCVVCGGIDWSLVPDPVPPVPPKSSPTGRFREWPKPIEWHPAPGPLGDASEWNPHIVHEESGFGPVGSITGWRTDHGEMAGAVPCDGRMLKREDYPALFDVLGTTYGGGWSGDEEPVAIAFAVPDLRARRAWPKAEDEAEKILTEMSKDEVKHLSFDEVMKREKTPLTYEDVMREMREIKGTRVTRREYEGRWLD